MEPILPSWFKQRQGKAEKVAEDVYKLTAPNLPEWFIAIRAGDNGRWTAALRQQAEGPSVAATQPEHQSRGDAWGAAFELYRCQVVV
jgi:hypothetical protein